MAECAYIQAQEKLFGLFFLGRLSSFSVSEVLLLVSLLDTV